MKKIVSLIGAGAMLLSVATPAFAAFTVNRARVRNTTVVKANSGENTLYGNTAAVAHAGVSGDVEVEGDNRLTTGNAEAENVGVIAANTSVGCSTCGTGSFTVNRARVRNTTVVKANSGENTLYGNTAAVEHAGVSGEVEVEGNNSLTTGGAEAENVGVIVVNTSVSFH